ncbi:MAG: hypothetical protein LBL07_03590 [Tannerella sp.]|jgi:hypothetical protein|nr:hypothetical protein [Tannerella sp.]
MKKNLIIRTLLVSGLLSTVMTYGQVISLPKEIVYGGMTLLDIDLNPDKGTRQRFGFSYDLGIRITKVSFIYLGFIHSDEDMFDPKYENPCGTFKYVSRGTFYGDYTVHDDGKVFYSHRRNGFLIGSPLGISLGKISVYAGPLFSIDHFTRGHVHTPKSVGNPWGAPSYDDSKIKVPGDYPYETPVLFDDDPDTFNKGNKIAFGVLSALSFRYVRLNYRFLHYNTQLYGGERNTHNIGISVQLSARE